MKLGLMATAAAAFAFVATSALAAETKGPVTDEIGVVKIAKDDPVTIGFYGPLSGANAPLGVDMVRSIQILIADKGGEILGHPVRLLSEDGECSAGGGQTATTKLASNRTLVAVVGGVCSSETTPGAPILWKSGIASVSPSSTAPALTAADRNAIYQGFARVAWNDAWAGAEVARWAYEKGYRKGAGIHDGSPYAQSFVDQYAKTFEELGGTITSIEAISPTDTEMRPMLTKIASDAPEIVFAPIFVQSIGYIVRQKTRVSGLENTVFIGSDASMSPQILELGGRAITGFQIATNDISTEKLGSRYEEFVAKYEAEFGEKPVAGFHHFAYDAANVVFDAIKAVAVTDDDGNLYIGRKALRDAIYATEGTEGISGTKTCDENGDCGEFNFTVYEFIGSDEPFDIGVNPKKVYPN